VTGERVRKRYLLGAIERAAESRPRDGAAVRDAGASRPSENESCVETRCDVGTRRRFGVPQNLLRACDHGSRARALSRQDFTATCRTNFSLVAMYVGVG